jgi:hypothetical protein
MSHSRNKKLLSDVLAEESDSDFREALLDHTLHVVRRKRRFRKARQVAYASLMVIGVALIGFHFLPSKTPGARRFEPSYLLVTTKPLPPSAVFSTRRGDSIPVISNSATIELVTTTEDSPPLHQLDDNELLALVPSPALLVRRGPHLAELVFDNPDAQRLLSPN